jgi:glucose-6-phosphate 1-dehydrogenase
MTAPHSDALVFFGATGDLAYKKIFPALQKMVRRGRLDVRVIGVASSKWGLEQFKARARDSIEKHGGVEGRGKFYEEAGAIRDVVQNHMLQVIACLGMEPPAGRGHEQLRDERGRLLEHVRTLTPEDVVRGQFRGYRNEPDVALDSQVETFAAVRFHIDNERWEGVPFYVRAGKRLPVTATEIMVGFERTTQPVLDDITRPLENHYRFRLSPEEVLALGAKVKKPGERMEGRCIELIAHYQPPDEMEPYERLLGDAISGDATLFAREDSVEAAWRVVDPILGNRTPLYEYEPGTWGPPEAGRLAPEGWWHDPSREGCPDGGI